MGNPIIYFTYFVYHSNVSANQLLGKEMPNLLLSSVQLTPRLMKMPVSTMYDQCGGAARPEGKLWAWTLSGLESHLNIRDHTLAVEPGLWLINLDNIVILSVNDSANLCKY